MRARGDTDLAHCAKSRAQGPANREGAPRVRYFTPGSRFNSFRPRVITRA
jgi:hypothetical protein